MPCRRVNVENQRRGIHRAAELKRGFVAHERGDAGVVVDILQQEATSMSTRPGHLAARRSRSPWAPEYEALRRASFDHLDRRGAFGGEGAPLLDEA